MIAPDEPDRNLRALARLSARARRVNERGHLEIGGCDAVELAREFGTPAYVVAEDDLAPARAGFVGGARGPPRGLRRAVRLQGVSRARPSTGCSPRRGWPATWPPAGSWRWRCAAASTRAADLLPRQRQVRRGAARGARGRASATSCSTPSTTSSGSSTLAAELGPHAGGADPGHARRRRRHPRRDLHRPGRLQVRLLDRRGARRRSSRLRRRRRSEARRPALPHRLPAVRARAVPGRGAARSPRSATSPSTTSVAASAAAYTAAQQPPAVAEYVEALVEPPRTSTWGRTSGCCSSRGGRWWPTRRSRSTPWRRSSATSRPGSRSTAACRTTCGRCSTAPATRR